MHLGKESNRLFFHLNKSNIIYTQYKITQHEHILAFIPVFQTINQSTKFNSYSQIPICLWGLYHLYTITPSLLRPSNRVRKISKSPRQGKRKNFGENHRGGIPFPRMGKCAIDVTSSAQQQDSHYSLWTPKHKNWITTLLLFRSCSWSQTQSHISSG